MHLDVRTTFALTAFTAFILNGGLIVTARACSGRVNGVGRWAAACAGEALGWGLLGLRGFVPDILSIVVVNTLVLLAAATYYHALKEFYDEPPKARVPYALAALAAVALSYFSFVKPDMAARVAIVSLIGAALTLLCARTLLRGPRRQSTISRVIGCDFLGCGLALLARLFTLLFLSGGARQSYLAPDMAQAAVYLGGYACLVVLTVGFLLLCNERLNQDLLWLATRDSLTGAYNRRTIEELAHKEVSRRRRVGLSATVLLVDLDHFKSINDTHGHATGDAVLKEFVATAAGQLRAQDMLGRYGGEEFLIVLPDTAREQASAAAERLRAAVSALMLDVGTQRVRVTVSIGVAEFSGDDHTLDTILERADAALYEAKAQGRNRITFGQRLAS